MSRGFTLTLVLISGLFFSCVSGPAHGESPQRSPGYQTVARGSYSGVLSQREVLIESEAAFERLWRELHSGRSPVPQKPSINFETHQIAAVFAGEKPSGGFSVEVTTIQTEEDYLTIYFQEQSPSPGDIVTQALTQPYHIVQFPRTERDIRFRSRSQ
ncbi:MAG: protease complex subunit PrcB family protein [Spirochaetaceae bacterium]|nr:MAG: protease complex subunit PrcB family protein [Spirochaetaceae bacterium]